MQCAMHSVYCAKPYHKHYYTDNTDKYPYLEYLEKIGISLKIQ